MNNIKGAMRNIADSFNSAEIPSNDTIAGLKLAIGIKGRTDKAIEEHRKEQNKPAERNEDRFIAEQERILNELKNHFDRNRNGTIDTRDNDEEVR